MKSVLSIFLIVIIAIGAYIHLNNRPITWQGMHIPTNGLIGLTDLSNSNCLDVEYQLNSHQELVEQTIKWLSSHGYKEVSRVPTFTDSEHVMVGVEKGNERLAFKYDIAGNTYTLSVFNRKGNDIMYGLCFGHYEAGEVISGQEAKNMLLKELDEVEKENGDTVK